MIKKLLSRCNAGQNENTRGFTLVEVIISIAALGLICAVLLRLFVVADDTNNKASNAQKAELAVVSAMETLACADTMAEGLVLLGFEPDEDVCGSYADNGLIIDIRDAGGDYPGTLYNVTVRVTGDDKTLSEIATKKYQPLRTKGGDA